MDLSSAGYAEGAVNSGTVTDGALQLAGGELGEAAINLTAAGVFPAGQCVNFASAFLKSRSSASFTAEVKDFIAPGTANITNCGGISIHKTDGSAALANAGFTLYAGGTASGTTCTGGTVAGTCTTAADGTCTFGTSLPFGTYCVAETTTPTDYFTADAQMVTISAAADSATLEFVDKRQPGALLITKTNTDGTALAGATFSVTDSTGTVVGGGTSDSSGHVCLTGLVIGATYTVTETAAPANYNIDTPNKSVTIQGYSPDCATSPTTLTFTDSPLSDISCTFSSDAGAGLIAATIQCTGDSGTSSFTTYSLNNLVPGTYSCTFVISGN